MATQLSSFNFLCQELQPSLPCVDSSTNQTVRLPSAPLLYVSSVKRLKNQPSNYAGGLDCMDRLGIRGEVAAREGDKTVDDPRRYLDSDRVWRATPAFIP